MEVYRFNGEEYVKAEVARELARALQSQYDDTDPAVEMANELVGELYVYRGDEFKVEGFPMMFEPGRRLPENWTEARRGCNTLYILTGSFECHTFNLNNCRAATEEERETYFALKRMVENVETEVEVD